jgi:hypothetical protein
MRTGTSQPDAYRLIQGREGARHLARVEELPLRHRLSFSTLKLKLAISSMKVHLELTPDIQASLLAQAHESGLRWKRMLSKCSGNECARPLVLLKRGHRLPGDRIRELRKGVRLDSIPIKELIEERRESLLCCCFEDEATNRKREPLAKVL